MDSSPGRPFAESADDFGGGTQAFHVDFDEYGDGGAASAATAAPPPAEAGDDDDDADFLGGSTQRFEPTLAQVVGGSSRLDSSADDADLLESIGGGGGGGTQAFGDDPIAEADRIIDSQLQSLSRDGLDAPPTADEQSAHSALFSHTQPFGVLGASFGDTDDDDAPRSPIFDTQPFDAPRSPSPPPLVPNLADDDAAPQSPAADYNDEFEDELAAPSAQSSERRRRQLSDSDDDDEADAPPAAEAPPPQDSQDQEGASANSSLDQSADNVLAIAEERTDGGEEAAGEEGSEGDKSEVGVGGLIADIFGESDAEHDDDLDHDTTGLDEGESSVLTNIDAALGLDDDDDDDTAGRRDRPPDFEWDFDRMMQRKKDEGGQKRRRRREGVIDLLSDADEQIKDLVNNMKLAAKEDRRLNQERKPALHKRKTLPHVVKQLRKHDLLEALVDFGIMTAISEWIAPLPDKSLPALEVRCEMLKILQQFPKLEQNVLRNSGVGKAVMLLLKHPKETRENRNIAAKVISDWARPIFQLDTDYRLLSKEEREQRDYEHMPLAKRRRLSREQAAEGGGGGRGGAAVDDDERPLRPGDKGWIGRARVPQPSTKDYVVRPKSNVDGQFRGSTGRNKTNSAMNKKLREFQERTRGARAQHAVPVSINGGKRY